MTTGGDHRKAMVAYYDKTESRFGYGLLFGGRKHFGYYPEGRPHLSIRTAQRLMEDRLGIALDLPAGSLVLDTGCGEGHTAMRLAERFGLRVEGVDLLDFNIAKGSREAARRGLAEHVFLRVGDYTQIPFPDDHFDAMYTIESLVHAEDHRKALAEFWRVLRPSGKIVLLEYSMPAHHDLSPTEREIFAAINAGSVMPSFPEFVNGSFPAILAEAGFEDVTVTDIRYRIEPMLRHMARLCWLPYRVAKRLGRPSRYVNAMAAVEYHRLREHMHYNIVIGYKPAS